MRAVVMDSLSTTAPSTLAIYLRVSGEEQKRQETIENQRAAADRYLAIHDITPYSWYEDDGVSGTIAFDKRPAGRRLIADAEVGAVKTVLVWRLDRFGRSNTKIYAALELLESLGVRLVSMTENFDTETPAGKAMLGMLATFAQFERDSIVQRTDEGKGRRLRAGGWMGGAAPYGYVLVGKDKDAHLEPDDAWRWCPLPDGQEQQKDQERHQERHQEKRQEMPRDVSAVDVVQLVYTLLVEQRWGCHRVATHLNRLGAPTATSRRQGRQVNATTPADQTADQIADASGARGLWRANAVWKLAANPVYKGVLAYGRETASGRQPGQEVDGQHEALVTPEQWEAAQRLMHANTSMSRRNAKREYLLHGLIHCALCGCVYGGKWYISRTAPTDTWPGGYRAYVCNGKRFARIRWGGDADAAEAHRCPSTSLAADWIEEAVWADVEAYVRDPEATLRLLAARMSGQADQQEALRTEMAALSRQIEGQQVEKDKVIALFRKGFITERDVQRQYADLAHEDEALRRQYARLAGQAEQAADVAERLAKAEATLQRLRAKLDAEQEVPEVRRHLIEDMVSSILVDVEEVGTSKRGRSKRRPVVYVTYCFDDPAATSTGQARPTSAIGVPTARGRG